MDGSGSADVGGGEVGDDEPPLSPSVGGGAIGTIVGDSVGPGGASAGSVVVTHCCSDGAESAAPSRTAITW